MKITILGIDRKKRYKTVFYTINILVFIAIAISKKVWLLYTVRIRALRWIKRGSINLLHCLFFHTVNSN